MARLHTHYDNLMVSRNAHPEVSKAAFRALSQRYHPDRNDSPDATRIMKILNEAYAVLSDPEARHRYDATIVDERFDSSPHGEVDPQTSTASERTASRGSHSGPSTSSGQSKQTATDAKQPPGSIAATTDWRFVGGLVLVCFLIFCFFSLR